MKSKSKSLTASTISPAVGSPIEPLVSSRLIVVANLLRRGAARRYEKLLGLTSVEFGIVAMLGRRKPVPVRTLAALVGMDKAQLSRALARLVERKIVSRTINPADSRDVLVSLTVGGIAAHDELIATARRINGELTAGIPARQLSQFEAVLQELSARAELLLQPENA